MPRPEIIDRSPVEILLDDGRADVGRPRDGRSVPELLPHPAHHLGDATLGGGLAVRWPLLRELDRGRQRAAPRPEVLRSELLAQMGADVRVQPPLVEVAVRPLELEL